MQIKIETERYNSRRYGKPWIARVSFEGTKVQYAWGDWVGQEGDDGILILDASVGDIIARGQRDGYKSSNNAPMFFVVEGDGLLRHVSKAEAFKYYQQLEEQR